MNGILLLINHHNMEGTSKDEFVILDSIESKQKIKEDKEFKDLFLSG